MRSASRPNHPFVDGSSRLACFHRILGSVIGIFSGWLVKLAALPKNFLAGTHEPYNSQFPHLEMF